MGLFDRFKNDRPTPASDYERLSALGENSDTWTRLDKETLKRVIIVKCIEYGLSQDGARIPNLFALYRHASQVLDAGDRLGLLTELSQVIERGKGQGHMGLMMFLAGDKDRAVCSSAALSLSVLFDPDGGGPVAGPSFVVNILVNREKDPRGQGAGLGGVLLLGDSRVTPLLQDAWNRIDEDARLEMTKVKSGFVSEAIVEFWLWCLESDCSESVFGSVVAAIAKMPVIAQVPFVLKIQRQFPAYAGGEQMNVIGKQSFTDYLKAIRPRLEKLRENESEPSVIPHIYEMWTNPMRFVGSVG